MFFDRMLRNFPGEASPQHQATALCWEPHRSQPPDEEAAILGFSELTVDKQLLSAVSPITVGHTAAGGAEAALCAAVGSSAPRRCVTGEVE